MNSCLHENCSVEMKHRGLCGSHYKASERLVKSKRTTWEALESKGLALPPKQRWGVYVKDVLDGLGDDIGSEATDGVGGLESHDQ